MLYSQGSRALSRWLRASLGAAVLLGLGAQEPTPPQAPPAPPPGLLPLTVLAEIDPADPPVRSAVLHEGLVLLLTGNGVVEAFGSSNGEPLWKLGFPGEPLLAPRYLPEKILLSSGNGTLFLVLASSGEISEKLSVGTPLALGPWLAGGTLFLATPEGAVVAYDWSGRKERWRTETGESIRNLALGGERLLVSGGQRTLTALDRASGAVSWRLRARGAFEAPAIFDQEAGRIYVGDTAGDFYCLEAENGEIRFRWETGAAIESPVLLEPEHVFVVSFANTLFAYRPGNGHLLWRANLPGRPAGPAVRVAGRIAVATLNGYVVEFDAQTGKPGSAPYSAPEEILAQPSFQPPLVALTLRTGRVLLLKTGSPPPESKETSPH